MDARLRCPTGLEATEFSQRAAKGAPWPPAPHDPRDRELIATVAGWEVRWPGKRELRYFVQNGLWHIQLWNSQASVSVLTPSRLTDDRYQAFPIAGSHAGAEQYGELAKLIADEHSVAVLPELALVELERAFIQWLKTRVQRDRAARNHRVLSKSPG